MDELKTKKAAILYRPLNEGRLRVSGEVELVVQGQGHEHKAYGRVKKITDGDGRSAVTVQRIYEN